MLQRFSALWILLLATASLAAAEDAKLAEAKARLAPLQAFIGEWKGVGQRQRGKNEGSWIERTDWAWKFDKNEAAIAFAAEDAKYLPEGFFTAGEQEGQFVLTIPTKQAEVVYRGQLEDKKLSLDADQPVDGMPQRITLRLVAGDKRLIALYETKSASSDRLVRLAEVGYTRVGSGFGEGTQGPECVITGGFGSIEVSYAGKKYYVCCTGCKDYFDEDPQRAIDEYLARKKEERNKKAEN